MKILVSPVPCPTAGGDSGPHHKRRLTAMWVIFVECVVKKSFIPLNSYLFNLPLLKIKYNQIFL
jgi:hypothetical protein